LVYGIARVLDKPAWLTAFLAILASLAGPSGIIAVLIRLRARYVKKTKRRNAELEKRVDPNRESSDPDSPPGG
jgi:hypothetical protein